jgi:hypothetical protein
LWPGSEILLSQWAGCFYCSLHFSLFALRNHCSVCKLTKSQEIISTSVFSSSSEHSRTENSTKPFPEICSVELLSVEKTETSRPPDSSKHSWTSNLTWDDRRNRKQSQSTNPDSGQGSGFRVGQWARERAAVLTKASTTWAELPLLSLWTL